MTLETWLAFLVACWVISLSPGAGAIASMSCGLQYGFWRGYWNAIGLQGGLLAHFVPPVYLRSITIGRRFSRAHYRVIEY